MSKIVGIDDYKLFKQMSDTELCFKGSDKFKNFLREYLSSEHKKEGESVSVVHTTEWYTSRPPSVVAHSLGCVPQNIILEFIDAVTGKICPEMGSKYVCELTEDSAHFMWLDLPDLTNSLQMRINFFGTREKSLVLKEKAEPGNLLNRRKLYL